MKGRRNERGEDRLIEVSIKNNYKLKETAPKSSNHLRARSLIFQNTFHLLKIISQQS